MTEVEGRIAELARGQHGVVTRRQLLDLGLTRGQVRRRAERGRLVRLHQGVYRLGPLSTVWTKQMAAVLACGDEAVLSRRSAAVLWGLLHPGADPDPVDVSVSRLHGANRPGIRAHRTSTLRDDERTSRHRIPVTSPGRTLVDVAGVVGARRLEQAVARAERDDLVTRTRLQSLAERHAGRPGVPALRTVLEREGGPAFTRSEAEARFLGLIRRARLPAPESNVRLHGYEIDFLWRAHRVAVEIDGFRYHASRRSFEGDRRRAARLAARGIQVVPLTWRQVVDDGTATAVQIALVLARADPSRR